MILPASSCNGLIIVAIYCLHMLGMLLSSMLPIPLPSGRHPSAEYDMVRIGIGLYGIDPGNREVTLQESVSSRPPLHRSRKLEKVNLWDMADIPW